MAQQSVVGHGLLIIVASRSHSDTPHSVGLLWTSEQPVAETSTWQHTTLTRDRHPCPRRDFFFTVPLFPFDPFCTFKSFRPSLCHLCSLLVLIQKNTTQTSMPPGGIFFFFLPVRGFSPLIHFCTVLDPFVLHVTTLTTDRHPCLRRDSNPQSQQASGRRHTS
jgi:hypothetical protein